MNRIKTLWPYLLAIVVFAVVACVYMSPVLDGKVIATSDGIQGRAAVEECVEYTQKTGNHSWWTGSMFSGMPNYQIGGGQYQSDTWLRPLKRVMLWGHRNVIAIVLIYCLAFFALLRSMKVDKWLSIVGALAIAFSSYFFIIIGANHHSKTSTLALMSLALAGFYLIFHGHRKTGICFAMLGTMAGFYPHPQMAYYVCFIFAAFGVAELCLTIANKQWKAFLLNCVLALAALGIGVGTGTANTFANLEYAEETMRGGHSDLEKASDTENKTKGLDLDYATAWSYGINECWTFLVPDYMGGSSTYNVGKDSEVYKDMVHQGVQRKAAEQFCESLPTYWGDQPFTAGPVYMGAIVCLLFVLALLIVDGPYKWCLLAVTLLSIALSWGSHFMGFTRFFFDNVPMYNKFRTVSSILVIAEITMPLLGFLALRKITEVKKAALEAAGSDKAQYGNSPLINALAKKVLISGAVLVVMLLICLFTTSGFIGPNDEQMFQQLPDWLSDDIVMQRQAMFKGDVWRSMGFILAGIACLYLFVKSYKFNSTAILAVVLGVLVLGDMWPVNKRYMNDGMFSRANSYEQAYKEQSWEKQLAQVEKNRGDFRVFNLAANTFNDARTSYRYNSIGGYSAAKLRRYQDLIDQHLSKMHMPVINMLNAKYIVFQDKQSGETVVQQNPEAMGNAWYVDTLVVVQTPNEECDGLMKYDLHTTAVVDKKFEAQLGGQTVHPVDSAATVVMTAYTPESVEYDARSTEPGTVVFSEIYYDKGWKALVDDKPAEIFRADYALRALNLPAGEHHIRFEFRPESVAKGNTLSMCFVVAMYLIILVCIALGVKGLVAKPHTASQP